MNKKRELKLKVNARTLSRKKGNNLSMSPPGKNYHKTAGRRISLRGTDVISSTKIGAGDLTTRRSLPMDTLHKRDHRSSQRIGITR